jgi:hypothetical protein
MAQDHVQTLTFGTWIFKHILIIYHDNYIKASMIYIHIIWCLCCTKWHNWLSLIGLGLCLIYRNSHKSPTQIEEEAGWAPKMVWVIVSKRKILAPPRNRLRVTQPVASHCTANYSSSHETQCNRKESRTQESTRQGWGTQEMHMEFDWGNPLGNGHLEEWGGDRRKTFKWGTVIPCYKSFWYTSFRFTSSDFLWPLFVINCLSSI